MGNKRSIGGYTELRVDTEFTCVRIHTQLRMGFECYSQSYLRVFFSVFLRVFSVRVGEGQGSGSRIRLKLWGYAYGYRNMKKAAILDPHAKKTKVLVTFSFILKKVWKKP